MTRQKNNVLELIKLLAAFLVVFIHVPFYSKVGDGVETLGRAAVPLFFAVSGFFSLSLTPQKIKKRFLRILFLLCFAVVLYTLWNVLSLVMESKVSQIGAYFKGYLNLGTLGKLLLFNVSYSAGHLWYLLAMLYIYVIMFFVQKFRVKDGVLFTSAFLLLFANLALGEGLGIFGVNINIIYIRNFLFTGLPFFILGMMARKNEEKIKEYPLWVAALLMGAGAVESLGSRLLFGSSELYVGSVLMLFALVIVFVKYSQKACPVVLVSFGECSTYIYIVHLMISEILVRVYSLFSVDYAQAGALWHFVHPVAVCVVSAAVAFVITKAESKFKNKSV